jgi:hypothetical protein
VSQVYARKEGLTRELLMHTVPADLWKSDVQSCDPHGLALGQVLGTFAILRAALADRGQTQK